jgi:hypothetical protein
VVRLPPLKAVPLITAPADGEEGSSMSEPGGGVAVRWTPVKFAT